MYAAVSHPACCRPCRCLRHLCHQYLQKVHDNMHWTQTCVGETLPGTCTHNVACRGRLDTVLNARRL
jgi:hypothetical protein